MTRIKIFIFCHDEDGEEIKNNRFEKGGCF